MSDPNITRVQWHTENEQHEVTQHEPGETGDYRQALEDFAKANPTLAVHLVGQYESLLRQGTIVELPTVTAQEGGG
jgi:hypothetical protein